jgi:hypothetical protein
VRSLAPSGVVLINNNLHICCIVYLPKRKRPDKGVLEDESRPTIVFLNLCTKGRSRWQSGCFHHRLRSCGSAETKRLYMTNNPVRAGLACIAHKFLGNL